MEITSESINEADEDIEAEQVKKVEAALFIAGRYLSIQELITLTDVNPIILKKILSDLNGKYKNSGIEVVEQNGQRGENFFGGALFGVRLNQRVDEGDKQDIHN